MLINCLAYIDLNPVHVQIVDEGCYVSLYRYSFKGLRYTCDKIPDTVGDSEWGQTNYLPWV